MYMYNVCIKYGGVVDMRDEVPIIVVVIVTVIVAVTQKLPRFSWPELAVGTVNK